MYKCNKTQICLKVKKNLIIQCKNSFLCFYNMYNMYKIVAVSLPVVFALDNNTYIQ